MSLDLTFDKQFTLADVENKTTLTIENVNGRYYLRKEDEIVSVNNYACDNSDVQQDSKGKTITVDGITHRGIQGIYKILNDLVLIFQTRFITDAEEERWLNDRNLDMDELYTKATESFGYKVDGGVITIREELS